MHTTTTSEIYHIHFMDSHLSTLKTPPTTLELRCGHRDGGPVLVTDADNQDRCNHSTWRTCTPTFQQRCDEVQIQIRQHSNFEPFSTDLKLNKRFKHFVVECEFVEKSLFYN